MEAPPKWKEKRLLHWAGTDLLVAAFSRFRVGLGYDTPGLQVGSRLLLGWSSWSNSPITCCSLLPSCSPATCRHKLVISGSGSLLSQPWRAATDFRVSASFSKPSSLEWTE